MTLPLISNIDKPFAPLSVAPAQMEAAQAGAQAVQQQSAQAQETEHQLTEQQMGIAFGNLLRTGVEGAQAYVDDLQDAEVKQSAQNQLNSLMPALQSGRINPDMAQKSLLGFYQRVDQMNNAATIPGWKEKEDYKSQLRVDENKQIQKDKVFAPKKPSSLEVKQKAIPGLKRQLTELKSKKPLPETFISEVMDAKKEIEKAEKNIELFNSGNVEDITSSGFPGFRVREVTLDVLEKELSSAKEEHEQSIQDSQEKATYGDYLKAVSAWEKDIRSRGLQLSKLGIVMDEESPETPIQESAITPEPSVTGKGIVEKPIVSSGQFSVITDPTKRAEYEKYYNEGDAKTKKAILNKLKFF